MLHINVKVMLDVNDGILNKLSINELKKLKNGRLPKFNAYKLALAIYLFTYLQ